MIYGIGVVGAAGALQKTSQRIYAAPSHSDINRSLPAATRIAPSRSYEDIIRDVSRDLNTKLPMQADKYTRLDTTIPGPGRRLTYVYTYTGDVELDQEAITAALRASIVNGYKTTPGMAALRDHNVELHYLYRDKLGKHLGEIVVSPKDF